MIIEIACTDWQDLPGHLASRVTNQDVRLLDARRLVNRDRIERAVEELLLLGRLHATRTPIVHIKVNPGLPALPADAPVFDAARDLILSEFGLAQQPFVRVAHQKPLDGHFGAPNSWHQHLAVLRVDVRRGRLAGDLRNLFPRGEKIARILEHDFGLPFVSGEHNAAVLRRLWDERPDVAAWMEGETNENSTTRRRLAFGEVGAGARTGVSLDLLALRFFQALPVSKSSARSSLVRLAAANILLACGDRAAHIVLSREGTVHNLRKVETRLPPAARRQLRSAVDQFSREESLPQNRAAGKAAFAELGFRVSRRRLRKARSDAALQEKSWIRRHDLHDVADPDRLRDRFTEAMAHFGALAPAGSLQVRPLRGEVVIRLSSGQKLYVSAQQIVFRTDPGPDDLGFAVQLADRLEWQKFDFSDQTLEAEFWMEADRLKLVGPAMRWRDVDVFSLVRAEIEKWKYIRDAIRLEKGRRGIGTDVAAETTQKANDDKEIAASSKSNVTNKEEQSVAASVASTSDKVASTGVVEAQSGKKESEPLVQKSRGEPRISGDPIEGLRIISGPLPQPKRIKWPTRADVLDEVRQIVSSAIYISVSPDASSCSFEWDENTPANDAKLWLWVLRCHRDLLKIVLTERKFIATEPGQPVQSLSLF